MLVLFIKYECFNNAFGWIESFFFVKKEMKKMMFRFVYISYFILEIFVVFIGCGLIWFK